MMVVCSTGVNDSMGGHGDTTNRNKPTGIGVSNVKHVSQVIKLLLLTVDKYFLYRF